VDSRVLRISNYGASWVAGLRAFPSRMRSGSKPRRRTQDRALPVVSFKIPVYPNTVNAEIEARNAGFAAGAALL
jgi:hypothetical protein